MNSVSAPRSTAVWSHILTPEKWGDWGSWVEGLVCIHSQLAARMESLASGLTFRCAFHTLAPQPQVIAPDSCVYLSCMSQLVLLAEQKLLKRILSLHLSIPLHFHSSTPLAPWITSQRELPNVAKPSPGGSHSPEDIASSGLQLTVRIGFPCSSLIGILVVEAGIRGADATPLEQAPLILLSTVSNNS